MKKKERTYPTDAKSGKRISKAEVAANPDTTVTLKALHPFTQTFENVRKGEKTKAEKILKRLSDTEVEQFYLMLNDVFLSIMTRKKVNEQSPLKQDLDERAVIGEV